MLLSSVVYWCVYIPLLAQFTDIGVVSSIEINHKTVDTAKKGEEVCIKVESVGSEAPRLYGRHFDHTDLLVSKVSHNVHELVYAVFTMSTHC